MHMVYIWICFTNCLTNLESEFSQILFHVPVRKGVRGFSSSCSVVALPSWTLASSQKFLLNQMQMADKNKKKTRGREIKLQLAENLSQYACTSVTTGRELLMVQEHVLLSQSSL